MKNYMVTIPTAGHVYVNVEAGNEEQAKEKAYEQIGLTNDFDHEWDTLEQFSQGNVCHCPLPWGIEVEEDN